VLLPGRADHVQLFLGNARHVGELLNALLKNLQCLLSKMIDNLAGGLGANSLDQAGAEILFQRAC
jgi:hypothetical protein